MHVGSSTNIFLYVYLYTDIITFYGKLYKFFFCHSFYIFFYTCQYSAVYQNISTIKFPFVCACVVCSRYIPKSLKSGLSNQIPEDINTFVYVFFCYCHTLAMSMAGDGGNEATVKNIARNQLSMFVV